MPHEMLTAINRHRWWESRADSYMRDLGAFAYEEYEPAVVHLHPLQQVVLDPLPQAAH